MVSETHARVLDYLAHGRSDSFKDEPLAQVVGEDYYTLLEVTPAKPLAIQQRVFVGKEGRTDIQFIKGRIGYAQLTTTAKKELENAVRALVQEKEQQYLAFYNKAGPLSLRRHALELLPGLGKKNALALLDEREKAPFASFEDIKRRVPAVTHPEALIARRILKEIQEDRCLRYLFARPPKKARPPPRR